MADLPEGVVQLGDVADQPAVGDGDARFPEEVFRLIFEELHGRYRPYFCQYPPSNSSCVGTTSGMRRETLVMFMKCL
jgi:hypothetical protein